MKFEIKYLKNKTAKEEKLKRSDFLGKCDICGSFTKWEYEKNLKKYCSDECFEKKDKKNKSKFERNSDEIKQELLLKDIKCDEWKDILIVVKNQLDYLKQCIESIRKNTSNYQIYIWDNGSKKDTKNYIDNLVANSIGNSDGEVTSFRCENNVGFIHPNNEMISISYSPYVILLNSDTKVENGWDTFMINFLKFNEDVKQVGYFGVCLDSEGRGRTRNLGYDIDYVSGSCFCISRKTYEDFGLFSNDLKFAYFEDSDYSLRLKSKNHKVYALHNPLVHHYQNVTINEVEKQKPDEVRETFKNNHTWFKKRWADYLAQHRVSLEH